MSVAPNMYPHQPSQLEHKTTATISDNLDPAACMDVTHDDLLADLDGGLIFADDPFPSLPDFPSLSPPSPTSHSFPSTTTSPSFSYSSSSSSSSSSTSWPPPALPDSSSSPDLFPTFDDLLDHELFDSSTLLPDDDSVANLDLPEDPDFDVVPPAALPPTSTSDDLADVFLEWVRCNKEAISPEDLRSIKLKRSTIESAARRLGGGHEGMKHLLKLILAWVENHHLHGRRPTRDLDTSTSPSSFHPFLHVPLPSNTFPADVNPVCGAMQADVLPTRGGWLPTPELAAVRGLYGVPDGSGEPLPSWPVPGPFPVPVAPPHYPRFSHMQVPPPYVGGGFGVPYPAMGACFRHGEERVTNSATKEARKKRMARQRRFLSLHHHRANCLQQQTPPPPPPSQDQQLCSSSQQAAIMLSTSSSRSSSHSNDWLLWSNASNRVPTPALPDVGSKATTHHQNQSKKNQNAATVSSDRRQSLKSEKNLKFLLQKVLKQSDVGSLGRIVLPKKEAEIHLPELEARDGIPITMEDIGMSRTWNMRYRYWPNNKSRMYLLENTGDFVKSNGLQEGDFIVIYSDVKCGKYMIRGVKVRQPAESKTDGKSSGACAGNNVEIAQNGR